MCGPMDHSNGCGHKTKSESIQSTTPYAPVGLVSGKYCGGNKYEEKDNDAKHDPQMRQSDAERLDSTRNQLVYEKLIEKD